MKNNILFILILFFISYNKINTQSLIHINQLTFDDNFHKYAILQSAHHINTPIEFSIIETTNYKNIYKGKCEKATQVKDWGEHFFYKIPFTGLKQIGTYKIQINIKGTKIESPKFTIGLHNSLAKLVVPEIINYYYKQRANTREELNADIQVPLKGSSKRIDLRGGWADASADISKMFSHLSYANLMSPQQIPLVTWTLIKVREQIPRFLDSLKIKNTFENEALYGADYLMRSLSAEGYFYGVLFTYFKKDPKFREVVGLEANSVTTADYQTAFREGGGLAIATLARVSQWKKNGEFTTQQYLLAAQKAFDHLLQNNTKYDDDGKENIIDDYCALIAATELWIATDTELYQIEARKRFLNLERRLTPVGYFIANDSTRPFWHASDEGLPIVAIARFLDKEQDTFFRQKALDIIKKNQVYNLKITNEGNNPFGYAKQTINFKQQIKTSFFMPQENETGWWWQGECARLASMATSALITKKLIYNTPQQKNNANILNAYANNQLYWILGNNPYSICLMYLMGQNNVPYVSALYGHGAQKGGISNGITADKADGTGIAFKMHDSTGNEWRWIEQWLPHSTWFLQAISEMVDDNPTN